MARDESDEPAAQSAEPAVEPTPDDPRKWIDRRGLAAILGLSIERVDELRKQLNNQCERRSAGKRVEIFLPDWLRKWAHLEANQTGRRTAAAKPTRPQLIDRQRLLRIVKERDDWLERRGQLVDVDRVEEVVALFGALFKQRADGMCETCRDTFEQTLSDFDIRLEEEFPTDGGLGESDRAFLDSIERELRAAAQAGAEEADETAEP